MDAFEAVPQQRNIPGTTKLQYPCSISFIFAQRSSPAAPRLLISSMKADPKKVSLRDLSQLEVSLRSEPMSWVNDFVECEGQLRLLGLLKELGQRRYLTPYESDVQHQLVKSIKALMNTGIGLQAILIESDSIRTIYLNFDNRRLKTKGTILEIMAAVCLLPDGLEAVLDSLEFYKGHKGERFKFEPILRTMEQVNVDYSVGYLSKILGEITLIVCLDSSHVSSQCNYQRM